LKWSRRTTEKIANQLQALGIEVSPSTVSRLLKEMGFSLKVNRKSISHSTSPYRNEQFEYIAYQREKFACDGNPIISVDTKKKEQVGLFKNNGASWERESQDVNDHDFRSLGQGIAIPYGIYEPIRNRGTVFVGMSCDTAEFAVNSIAKWWKCSKKDYSGVSNLLILADGGGSNSSVSHAWKAFLQTCVADKFQIPVTVSHYPPGTSKWNPIEHRLFSEISKNWAGQPLSSYETILNYIKTTTTKTGLTVKATLEDKEYSKGIRISKEEFSKLAVEHHSTLPKWNYTISPR
jgi:Rhodopirellula transposase DDE domain/Winged helix-turn helix